MTEEGYHEMTRDPTGYAAVRGKFNDAEVRGGRLTPLSGTLIAAVAGGLLVAGAGAVASHIWNSSERIDAGETIAFSPSRSDSDGEMLARLAGYARSAASEESSSLAAAGKLLPDVNTMTDRLAARLETAPDDIEGWTLLMRSRVVLGEREVAATAFRKALEVFKDDSAASGKITAAAVELGLKAE
jgi:hypothetical protein